MAILDASKSTSGFNMSYAELVSAKTYMGYGGTFTGWNPDDDREHPDFVDSAIFVYGSGITVGGDNVPTGGTVTQVNINIDGSRYDTGIDSTVDVFITVDNEAMASMVLPASADPILAADAFWSTLLHGNDTIKAPERGGFVFGDFFSVRWRGGADDVRTGGNDTISAVSIGHSSNRKPVTEALVGDANEVVAVYDSIGQVTRNATLTGGNDRITQSGVPVYEMIGDVYFTNGSVVYGGDDTISSSVNVGALSTGYTSTIVGDVSTSNGAVYGGDDRLSGTNSSWVSDFIYGDTGNGGRLSRGGNDLIYGRAGQDKIAGDNRSIDSLDHRGGNDTIRGGDDSDVIAGDVLSQTTFKSSEAALVGGNDQIFGEDGNDIIAGDVYALTSGSMSTVTGGGDTIAGGDGNDQIHGDVFTTGVEIYSDPDPEFLILGGADRLYGEAGYDKLWGDSGNDTLRGGTGKDTLDGGSGIDTADYTDKTSKVEIKLSGSNYVIVKINGVAEDTLKNTERVAGGTAGDLLTGDSKANRLDGRSGNDTLSGVNGEDVLIGGEGKDRLTGGAHADAFVFNAALGSSNIDTITDFAHGSDRIQLDDAIFKALGSSITTDEFGSKSSGHVAADKQHIIYDRHTGTLWYDADDNGSGAAIQFATLSSKPTTISVGDFQVI
jgi:Ca2+-binding RTX toxin-like protein